MSFKVVNIYDVPDADFGERLLGPLGATFYKGKWDAPDEIMANVGDADAIILNATHQHFNRQMLAGLSNCRVLTSVGVGYSGTDLEAASEYGIAVTNVPD